MTIIELIILAIGLAMDAFAVSICKGLSTKELKVKHMLIAGLWFGGFQALMPVIGYFIGSTFAGYITSIDHWIAFVLLVIIGANMIKESREEDDDDECKDDCSCKRDNYKAKDMLVLAIATSIDALAVGVTFAFLKTNIAVAASIIGIVTLVISAIGIKIGNIFGIKYKSKAELMGGIILILIALKILIEHIFLK